MDAGRFGDILREVRAASVLAIDIETDGFSPWRGNTIRGISVADDSFSAYLPVSHPDSDNMTAEQYAAIINALSAVEIQVYHNCLFDLSFLQMEGMTWHDVWDTMVYAWLQDENRRLGLKELTGDKAEQDKLKDLMRAHCRDCLGNKSKLATKKMAEERGVLAKSRYCVFCGSFEWQEKRGWGDLTYEEMAPYATRDAELTWQLFTVQRKFIDVDPDIMEREMDLCMIALNMTERGLHVDTMRAADELEYCQREAAKIADRYDFSLGSTKQVGEALVTTGVKLQVKQDTGNIVADHDALLPYSEHPIVQDVLKYRALTKEGQFYEKLLEEADPRAFVHPRWRPTGTVSGRWSCADPNAMQWPRNGSVRKCITPDSKHYVYLSFDLSQAELRVASYYAQSAQLIEWFNSGEDVYMRVAENMGVDRQTAKTVVLGTQYGAGPRKLRTLLLRAGVKVSPKRAKELWEEWRALVPEIPKMRDKAAGVAWRRGYVKLVQPGRYRRFNAADFWRADPKDAFNALCQGGVAEAIKSWMLRVHAEGHRIVAQVHDSLVIEVHRDYADVTVALVTKAWEEVNPFPVEIPVDVKEGF